MNRMKIVLCIGMLSMAGFFACMKDGDSSSPKGDYLGQDPPGDHAVLFAPGIISTGHIEKSLAFSPEGDAVYWGILGDAACFIATMTRENNRWSAPRIAGFSGHYFDMEFCLSPDGKRLMFTSENRPIQGKVRDNADLWVVSKTDHGWGIPQFLGSGVNTDMAEYSPSVARSGTVYFYRRGEGGPEDWDIYAARLVDGVYERAKRLPAPVNTVKREFDPYIDPDERFIIFCAVDRDDGLGAADLYISHRQLDGSWGEAVNLGSKVNSNRWEFCPTVSPDGKYLFFASNRRFQIDAENNTSTFASKMKILDQELSGPGNGHSDFYWIDVDVIHDFKPVASK